MTASFVEVGFHKLLCSHFHILKLSPSYVEEVHHLDTLKQHNHDIEQRMSKMDVTRRQLIETSLLAKAQNDEIEKKCYNFVGKMVVTSTWMPNKFPPQEWFRNIFLADKLN